MSAREPHAATVYLIRVQREPDEAPWTWGGSEDEDAVRSRMEELRVEYPTYTFEVVNG